MFGWTVQNLEFVFSIGEDEGSKIIHNQLDPRQLHGSKRCTFSLINNGRDKRDRDRDDIGIRLELLELLDGVIDTNTSHHRFDNQGSRGALRLFDLGLFDLVGNRPMKQV